MKRRFTRSLAALVTAAFALPLIACDTGESSPASTGSSTQDTTVVDSSSSSSSSSTSSSSEPEQEITLYSIALPDGGDVYTVTSSHEECAEGETVTLTVAVIADNVEVTSVTYNGSPATDQGDGTWTFTMPAESVTIAVETTEISTVRQLVFQGDEHLTGTFTVGTETVTEAEQGASVFLRLTLDDSDYIVDTDSIDFGYAQDWRQMTSVLYSFTVGSADIVISIKSVLKDAIPVSVTFEEGTVSSYTLTDSKDGEVKDSFIPGHTVTLEATPAEGYRLISATSSEVSLTSTDENTWTFEVPEDVEAITIALSTEAIPTAYSVSEVNVLGAWLANANPSISAGETYEIGETVQFTFTGITANTNRGCDVTVFTSDWERVETIVEHDGTAYSASFVMPASDVSIYVHLTATESDSGIQVTFDENDDCYEVLGIENGATIASAQAYIPYFYVVRKPGAVIDSIELLDASTNESYWTHSVSTSMEYQVTQYLNHADGVHISIGAHYVGFPTVSIETIDGVTVNQEPADYYEAGDTVEFYIDVDSTLVLASIDVTTESGESFTADYDSGTGRVSFTMPEEDCTVTFTPAQVKQLGWTQTAGIEGVTFHEWDGSSLGDEITSAYSGVQVAVQVQYDQANYILNSVYAYEGGETLSYNSSADAFILTVPEDHEVELAFDLTAWESVTISAAHAEVTGLEERYQVGETATFQAVPDIGYQVTGVSVEGATVEEGSTAGSYSSVVPSRDLAGVEWW